MTQIREMQVKRTGQVLDESDTRMRRLLFAHVKAAFEQLSFDNAVSVGADEINRRKGHNSLTVFADLMAGLVLSDAAGKQSSVLVGNCCGTTAIPRPSSVWPST